MMSTNEQKEKFRQSLAESFASLLEEKGLNWVQGWENAGASVPVNAVTNIRYSGVNMFNLRLTQLLRGSDDPRWATMVQIIDAKNTYHPGENWHLKKGSKAAYVEYWFPYDLKMKKSITWHDYSEQLKSGRMESEFAVYPRYYSVFNGTDIEGLPAQKIEKLCNEIHEDFLINTLSENMHVPIAFDGGDNAYYSIREDAIHLPKPEAFFGDAQFAGVALHELAHSTGHESRLNREFRNLFGSEGYAQEELVAEMTSAFMAVNLNNIDLSAFNGFENNRAYVQNWIQEIRNKPDALIKAIKNASEATNYMEFKAGIIQEEEYERRRGGTFLHPEKQAVNTTYESKQPISRVLTAEMLADRLTSFAHDFDPYNFQDSEVVPGYTYQTILSDIKDGRVEPYQEYLKGEIGESRSGETIKEATTLLRDIDSYSSNQSLKTRSQYIHQG